MGIIVPEANLPMGITVSNVYMSFSGEVIYTVPANGQYRVNTYYKVYKDESKQPDTNIRIPIVTQTSNIVGRDVYTILYEELKTLYPGSTDIIYREHVYPTNTEVVPAKMTEDEYQFGIQILQSAVTYMQNHPDDTTIQGLYEESDANFGINGPATEQMKALRNALDGYVS
jgi:hypothetical protein